MTSSMLRTGLLALSIAALTGPALAQATGAGATGVSGSGNATCAGTPAAPGSATGNGLPNGGLGASNGLPNGGLGSSNGLPNGGLGSTFSNGGPRDATGSTIPNNGAITNPVPVNPGAATGGNRLGDGRSAGDFVGEGRIGTEPGATGRPSDAFVGTGRIGADADAAPVDTSGYDPQFISTWTTLTPADRTALIQNGDFADRTNGISAANAAFLNQFRNLTAQQRAQLERIDPQQQMLQNGQRMGK